MGRRSKGKGWLSNGEQRQEEVDEELGGPGDGKAGEVRQVAGGVGGSPLPLSLR